MSRPPPQKQSAEYVLKSPAGQNDRWVIGGVCLCVAAMVWAAFGGALKCGFVNFDDDLNVYQNSVVRAGLSIRGISWAFWNPQIGDWYPLTTISHLFDCQLYGVQPWGHHLGNVLLHGAGAMLLFLAIKRMTGELWRSAFVATVWAVHPLRVESVAWVSERKDALSGVFFMLTLLAYESYVRKGRQRWRYLLVVAVFGCGMMSKSMLVTLPMVLLLLDWWPLGRFQKTANWKSFVYSTRPLVLEKLPLLALSGMFAAVQVLSAKGAIVPLEAMPLWQRLANALNSYVVYVWQMFSPVNLAAFYPRPETAIPYWETALALAFLLSVTGLIYALREKCPWLGVGWLWYLGMLVPICGVLQAGDMAHADRFTYLPQIGLVIMLTWAGAEFTGRMRIPGWIVGALAGCVISTLTVMAREQTSYWRTSESLWRHALGCTENNYVAHDSLGNVLQERGELTEAVAHYQKALEIRPDYVGARNNLGEALREMGRLDEAVAQFQTVLQIEPGYAEASNNLGNVLRQMGRMDLAVARFQNALEIKPDYVEARYNLANALRQMDRIEESIAEYQKTLEIRPDYPEAQNNLAYILSASRDPRLRNGAVAEELALRANELTGGTSPVVLGTLGAAYAEEGRFSEAVETVKRAIPLAEGQGNIVLTSTLRKHLELYEAGKPLRDQ